jgi:hypothetical protein
MEANGDAYHTNKSILISLPATPLRHKQDERKDQQELAE